MANTHKDCESLELDMMDQFGYRRLLRHPATVRATVVAAATFLLAVACGLGAGPVAAAGKQSTYASPQEAVDALVSALKAGTTGGIVAVLGDDGEDIASSGDPVADAAARQRFIAAYEESHTLSPDGEDKATLVIGSGDYPFPMPIVRVDGAWRFDTAAGLEEILRRRIGKNELAAIEVVRAIVDAEREYAALNVDGDGPQYARQLLSSAGKKDGLYWPTPEGEQGSPLGPLVAKARAEGYRRHADAPPPYHGYVFRILTRQGKDAPGGAANYIVNGRMIGGFAVVAAPAQYGNSGVMTFIASHDGAVYEKDLGPDSSRIAASMDAFDPTSTWSKVAD